MSSIKSMATGLCAALAFAGCCDMSEWSAAKPGSSGATASGGTASPSGFPDSALVTSQGESGALSFELRTAPSQPPPRGTSTAELRITDASSGAPVDDLAVQVVPWMVAMGHGSSGKPTVTASGGGKYVVSNVSLYMAGQWELRITVTGSAADSVALPLDVR